MPKQKLNDYARQKLNVPLPTENLDAEAPPSIKMDGGGLPSMSLEEVEPRTMEALWPARLWFRTFAILEGRKATGKSQIACAIAAALTAGRGLPGRKARERCSVLWLCVEDDPGATLRPRLEAAGADLSRVHLVGRNHDRKVRIELPDDVARLGRLAWDVGARLIIIEPIASFVRSSLSLVHEQDARVALEPLAELAQEQNICVLGQRHVRKGGGPALDAGLGHVAVGNLARTILRTDNHPSRSGRYILWRVAGNMLAPPSALEYGFETVGESSRVVWHGESKVGEDRLSASCDQHTADCLEDAKRLLIAKLKEGRVRQVDIRFEGDDAGVTLASLRRAKKLLGVKAYRRVKDGKAFWEWGFPGNKGTPDVP